MTDCSTCVAREGCDRQPIAYEIKWVPTEWGGYPLKAPMCYTDPTTGVKAQRENEVEEP